MEKIDLIIDALKNCSEFQPKKYYEIDKALAAARELQQELATPEQEPVAWIYDWYGYESQSETKVLVKDWIASVYSEVSDPTIGAHNIRPLYTAPPKREWVGLTSEDWENTPDTGKQGCERDAELFDWVEQTLKDKNT